MTTNKNVKKFGLLGAVPLAAAGILGVSLFGGGVAGAAGTVGGGLTSTVALVGQGQTSDTYVATLASNLGISEATLRDALKKTNLSEVDAAVTAGKITAEQATTIKDKINASEGSIGVPGLRGGPDGGRGHGGGIRISADDLATFLGADAATLRTELDADGATLATVAQAHGKSRDQLKAFLTTTNDARLAEKQAAGDLTAEEVAARKTEFAANLDAMIDREGHGPKGGQRMERPAADAD